MELRQYRRGLITICGITRRVLPQWLFAILFPAGAVALAVHVWRGYERLPPPDPDAWDDRPTQRPRSPTREGGGVRRALAGYN